MNINLDSFLSQLLQNLNDLHRVAAACEDFNRSLLLAFFFKIQK